MSSMPIRLLLAPNGKDQPSSSSCLPLGGSGRARSIRITVPLTMYGSGGRGRAPASPRAAGHGRLADLEQADRHLGALGAEPRVLAEHPEAAALAVEQVLVELQPDVAQRVGRVVGVGDPLLAADRAAWPVSSVARMT